MSQEEQDKQGHAQDLTVGGADRSSAPSQRAAEEDLPPSLKAFEAALASLSPRTDRLDRERLIFLAGQQSVAAGSARPARRAGRWAWPAAFAAMTAVAAALLARFLVRPEPPVELRFVKVPAERAIDDKAAPEQDVPGPTADGGRVEPPPAPGESPSKLSRRSSWLAWLGPDWLEVSQRERFGSEASYARLRDQVLTEGLDSWVPAMPAETPEPTAPPVPYRQLLNDLREDRASSDPLQGWPASGSLFKLGGNS